MRTNTSRAQTNKPVVVVEIGGDWVKAIRVEPSRGKASISRMHLEKLKGDDETLVPSLTQALNLMDAAHCPVIGCLPRQMVNVRVLELPSTDPEEIAAMVDLQADKQTPYSKDEIVSGYRILGRGRDGYTRVMLAIIQRAILRHRHNLLEDCGVDVERMSVSTEGLLGWHRSVGGGTGTDSGVLVLLDVDSSYSDFVVIWNGTAVFTRSILVGADQLMESPDKWKEKLAQELTRSIETCQGETPGVSPDRLLVSGAGRSVEGLASFLGERLGIPADEADPLSGIAVSGAPPLNEAPYRSASLTSLVGMGLAPGSLEFNLMPDSVCMRRSLALKARRLTGLGVSLLVALFALSVCAFLSFGFKKGERDALRDSCDRTAAATRQVQRMQEVVNVVHERQDDRLSVVKVLAELHPQVPAGVYFDLVEIDDGAAKVTLSGYAGGRNDISELVQNLERSPLFKDAQEGSTSMGRDKRFKFQIVCTLER